MTDADLSSLSTSDLAKRAEEIAAQIEPGAAIELATAVSLIWQLVQIVRELDRRR